jgi:uncharacterized protein (TIGR00266 family)
MEVNLNGAPAFGHLDVQLQPGETITAEAGAMASMTTQLDMKAKMNGGFFKALGRKFLGGESFFINHFTNNTAEEAHLVVSPPTPGELKGHQVDGTQKMRLQPGAYLASTPGVKIKLRYAGLASFLGREGLFAMEVSGSGTVWYGAYGGLIEKEVNGELIVDTSHLVSYSDGLKLKVGLAGGIFSSFFSGEGLVTRVIGRGKITIQSRSLPGLRDWINPKLWG